MGITDSSAPGMRRMVAATPRADVDQRYSEAAGDDLPPVLAPATQEILTVTYWFEPTTRPEPYSVTIRFVGRRLDVQGRLQPRDRFVHDETINDVLPGSGPISLTAKIRDIHPGVWSVNARIVKPAYSAHGRRGSQQGDALSAASPSRPDTWFWRRWAPSAGPDTLVSTCMAPFARVPGAIPLIWVLLVTLGMALALAIQTVVLALDHLAVGPIWVWTLVAIGVGIAGAKGWYVIKHRAEHRIEGWCIQGFITGATVTAVILFTVYRVPTGTVLDATTPGLLLGLAVGRVGCFLAGCCGGPPTSSRWGVWSSDQRVGARRVPTQLLESALALSLGMVTLVAILGHGPAGGAYFAAALAAYTLGRQGLLRLRAEPLQTRMGGPIVAALAALVLVAAVIDVVLLAW